jgi:4-amino-4-deoxy-L-arabinose transferase-like glycosyltransferase
MKASDKLTNFLRESSAKRDLLVLLLLSATLKAFLALFIGVINHDGVLYILAAQKIATGSFKEALNIYGMPLYPLLIILTHYVIPNWIAAARLVSIAASIFTIIPLYFLTKEIFYRQAAMWACAAFVLLPLSNHLSVGVVRDPLFLFFFAWSTYFANHAIKSKKTFHFLLSSLTCLLSILCRLEGLILCLFYTLYVFYLSLRRSQDRNALLKGMLVYISPLLLISVLFSLGTKWPPTFNRIDAIILKINEILHFKFLDNYTRIYNQLKIVEKTMTRVYKWQNLIEIVRHYMPIIYLIGLLENFFRALFPPYVIPLAVGLRKTRNRNNLFVILLVASYFLMLYYYLISMDTIRVRFFLTPVFLLFPWIGVGIDRLYIYARDSSKKRLFVILLVTIFALLPFYRSLKILRRQDEVLIKAGKWIATVPQFKAAGIVTTDRRVPFYAGRGADFFFYGDPDYLQMETFAAIREMDLLVIKTSKKERNHTPRLKNYRKVEEFVGVKDIVGIYCSPRLYGTVEGKI